MPKVPTWLSTVNTLFVCCKDKGTRSITELRPEELQPHSVRNEMSEIAGADSLEDEETTEA